MNSDDRCTLYAARIMESIGAELSRRMIAAGFPADVIFEETREACTMAAYTLDRLTRAAHEAEEAERGVGDEIHARELLFAADHFRACMLRRLPPDVDIRIMSGDIPPGAVEIIRRGEPHDYRP